MINLFVVVLNSLDFHNPWADFVNMVDEYSSFAESDGVSGARQATMGAIVEILLREDAVSRAEIARRTGLSKQTASEVIRILEDSGWIKLRGQTRGTLGRRALTYELDSRNALVLGVDLGGTKLRLALADLRGNILGEDVQPTDPRGGHAVVEQIRSMTAALVARLGIPMGRVRQCILGSPGVFQPESGAIHLAPNIPGLDAFDVAGALSASLGFPVAIENDVNLATLGERRSGAPANMVFIALGTGIGMGILADGRLVQGARGCAGEVAYLPLGGDPFDARGARLGTLETAVGSVAIKERYRGRGGDPALDVRGIFERLVAGDPAATATIDEVARILATVVMAARALLDPETVVFGGSVGARTELVERVRHLIGLHAGGQPEVRVSALGTDAVLFGAVGMALDRLHDRLFGINPGAVRVAAATACGSGLSDEAAA